MHRYFYTRKTYNKVCNQIISLKNVIKYFKKPKKQYLSDINVVL